MPNIKITKPKVTKVRRSKVAGKATFGSTRVIRGSIKRPTVTRVSSYSKEIQEESEQE